MSSLPHFPFYIHLINHQITQNLPSKQLLNSSFSFSTTVFPSHTPPSSFGQIISVIWDFSLVYDFFFNYHYDISLFKMELWPFKILLLASQWPLHVPRIKSSPLVEFESPNAMTPAFASSCSLPHASLLYSFFTLSCILCILATLHDANFSFFTPITYTFFFLEYYLLNLLLN